MSDKIEPTLEEQIQTLNIEYSKHCGHVGDLTYHMDCLTAQREEIYVLMRNINREGDKLKKQLKKEKSELAGKLTVTEPTEAQNEAIN